MIQPSEPFEKNFLVFNVQWPNFEPFSAKICIKRNPKILFYFV